jgi:hypothetical protein
MEQVVETWCNTLIMLTSLKTSFVRTNSTSNLIRDRRSIQVEWNWLQRLSMKILEQRLPLNILLSKCSELNWTPTFRIFDHIRNQGLLFQIITNSTLEVRLAVQAWIVIAERITINIFIKSQGHTLRAYPTMNIKRMILDSAATE